MEYGPPDRGVFWARHPQKTRWFRYERQKSNARPSQAAGLSDTARSSGARVAEAKTHDRTLATVIRNERPTQRRSAYSTRPDNGEPIELTKASVQSALGTHWDAKAGSCDVGIRDIVGVHETDTIECRANSVRNVGRSEMAIVLLNHAGI
jgi:hypothetical protein